LNALMAKAFRAWDVDQPMLLPPSVRDLVPEGHTAHFVRELVRDVLDLSEIVSSYSEERGYPPYNPVMMTALLLYAYSQGVYSSRKIAQACEERTDFMAVTAMQRPDFRTINSFRLRHASALSRLFVQVLRLCFASGLVKLGHVALDGTKIRANASKHRAMSYGRMKVREAELTAEVAGWFEEAEAADATDDSLHGVDRRGDELPEWVRDKRQRLERIRAAKAALEAEAAESVSGSDQGSEAGASACGPSGHVRTVPPERKQRNFTDPESRIMKTSGGFEQAYNAQAAVDASSQVVVAAHVTNACNDSEQLHPMLDAIQSNTGRDPAELSADSGYCSERNLAELDRRGIRGYIATGRQKHSSPWPIGPNLGPVGGRTRRMVQRLRCGGRRSRYRLRKQSVEPVFGQIKAVRGFRQFLRRGLAAVADEWHLVCTAHNLLKLAKAGCRSA